MKHHISLKRVSGACVLATIIVASASAQTSADYTTIRKKIDSELMAVAPDKRPQEALKRANDIFPQWKKNPSDRRVALKTLLLRAYALTDQIPEALVPIPNAWVKGNDFKSEYELSRALYLNDYHSAPLKKYEGTRQKFLQKNPNDLLALLAVSFEEGWKGDHTMGLDLAKKAAKLDPENYLVYHRMAVAYHYRYDEQHQTGDAQGAVNNYQRFIDLAPKDNWRLASIKQRLNFLKGKLAQ